LPFLFWGSPVLLCNENHLLFNIWQYHDNNPLDCSSEHAKYKSFMLILTIVLIPSRFWCFNKEGENCWKLTFRRIVSTRNWILERLLLKEALVNILHEEGPLWYHARNWQWINERVDDKNTDFTMRMMWS
jgi:hypothetical protein